MSNSFLSKAASEAGSHSKWQLQAVLISLLSSAVAGQCVYDTFPPIPMPCCSTLGNACGITCINSLEALAELKLGNDIASGFADVRRRRLTDFIEGTCNPECCDGMECVTDGDKSYCDNKAELTTPDSSDNTDYSVSEDDSDYSVSTESDTDYAVSTTSSSPDDTPNTNSPTAPPSVEAEAESSEPTEASTSTEESDPTESSPSTGASDSAEPPAPTEASNSTEASGSDTGATTPTRPVVTEASPAANLMSDVHAAMVAGLAVLLLATWA